MWVCYIRNSGTLFHSNLDLTHTSPCLLIYSHFWSHHTCSYNHNGPYSICLHQEQFHHHNKLKYIHIFVRLNITQGKGWDENGRTNFQDGNGSDNLNYVGFSLNFIDLANLVTLYQFGDSQKGLEFSAQICLAQKWACSNQGWLKFGPLKFELLKNGVTPS